MPTLRSPVLITAFEGWNDAGDAASIAARHFVDRWKSTALAEIDAEHFYDFTTTRPLMHLNEGHKRSLTWPTNLFQSCVVRDSDRDLVVLLGIEPQLRWKTFCNLVIETARTLEVTQIVTLGALLADVPHSRPVAVYGASDDGEFDDDQFQELLDLAPSSYEGPTGIVGVLATQCRDAGLPTASLWSAVPSYVPGAPSPKAGLALVQRVSVLLGTSVFATDLELAAETYERQVNELLAEDEETASFVAELEEAWDEDKSIFTDANPALTDDPATLLAEVEQFLKEND